MFLFRVHGLPVPCYMYYERPTAHQKKERQQITAHLSSLF
jgi:hypothetical protein